PLLPFTESATSQALACIWWINQNGRGARRLVRKAAAIRGSVPHRLRASESAVRLPPSSLAHVIGSPKWLPIAVVEGDRLLFRIGQIERAQRFDVIDMPLASVIPRHSPQEFRFQMAHKLGH